MFTVVPRREGGRHAGALAGRARAGVLPRQLPPKALLLLVLGLLVPARRAPPLPRARRAAPGAAAALPLSLLLLLVVLMRVLLLLRRLLVVVLVVLRLLGAFPAARSVGGRGPPGALALVRRALVRVHQHVTRLCSSRGFEEAVEQPFPV
jgi:hypothetical protein